MCIKTGWVQRHGYHEDGAMGPKFHGIHEIHTATAVNLLCGNCGKHEQHCTFHQHERQRCQQRPAQCNSALIRQNMFGSEAPVTDEASKTKTQGVFLLSSYSNFSYCSLLQNNPTTHMALQSPLLLTSPDTGSY